MNSRLRSILIACALIAAVSVQARADSTSSPDPRAPDPASGAGVSNEVPPPATPLREWSVYTQLGVALRRSDTLPDGFKRRDLDPAQIFGLRLEPVLESGKGPRLGFDGMAVFEGGSVIPYLESHGWLGNRWGDLVASGEFGFAAQDMLSRSPYDATQFSRFRYEIGGEVAWTQPQWRVGFRYRDLLTSSATLANSEGFTTEIRNNRTEMFAPVAEWRIAHGLRVFGSAEYWRLGAAALANREAGFVTNGGNHVWRFVAGAAVPVADRFELSLRYERVTAPDDPIEHLYQAYFLGRDSLLVPQLLRGEVSWKF